MTLIFRRLFNQIFFDSHLASLSNNKQGRCFSCSREPNCTHARWVDLQVHHHNVYCIYTPHTRHGPLTVTFLSAKRKERKITNNIEHNLYGFTPSTRLCTHIHTLTHFICPLNFSINSEAWISKKREKDQPPKQKLCQQHLLHFPFIFRERGKTRWTSAVIMIISIDITNGETIMNYFAIKFQQRTFPFEQSAKSQQRFGQI